MQSVDQKYIKKRRKISVLIERLFVSLMNVARSPDGRRPDDLDAERVRSVLVIRHNQLGDAVAASPFIAAIKERWPLARIDVLASEANAEAFTWVRGVDRVHRRSPWLGERLRQYLSLRHQYDIVFQTLIDESYFSRALAARYIAGRGVAVGRKRGSPLEELFDHSVFVPRGGYVGKLMALLLPLQSADSMDSIESLLHRHPQHRVALPEAAVQSVQHKLRAQGVEPRTYIALNISARVAARELGTEQAASLANACMRKGLPVVLLHAPADQQRAALIHRLAPGIVSPRCASLAEAMAVAQNARLYLGADTGTAHFAAAGYTPCVVLFSYQATADVWSPYGVPFVSIQANPYQSVAELDETVVVEYVDRMLAGEPLTRIVKSVPDGFSVGAPRQPAAEFRGRLSVGGGGRSLASVQPIQMPAPNRW